MTIGDILAVIAAVMLTAASWGAAVLMTGLLFPSAVAQAEARLLVGPARNFWCGAGIVLLFAVMAIVCGKLQGPFRLAAVPLWATLIAASAVGSAAVVRLMSERIGGLGTEMTPFARLTRAAVLYVASGFVPVVGWFILTPAAAMITVGAGIGSLGGTRPSASVVSMKSKATSHQPSPWKGEGESESDTPLSPPASGGRPDSFSLPACGVGWGGVTKTIEAPDAAGAAI